MKLAVSGYGFILSHSGSYYWHSDPGNMLINPVAGLASSSVYNGNGWTNGVQATSTHAIPWPTSLAVQQLEPTTPNSGTDWDNIGMDRGSCCHVISGGGGYSELIVFSTALSSTNRSALASNEKTYFGIVTLPLSWASFTALADGAKTYLHWQLTSQNEQAVLQVEYSMDGQTWSSIARLPVTADSYVHGAPGPGKNFYRMAVIGPQGAITYSTVSVVNFDQGRREEFKILNNPVQGTSLSVKLLVPTTLSIFGTDGHLLWRRKCTAGRQDVPLDGFPKGPYVIKGERSTGRFLLE